MSKVDKVAQINSDALVNMNRQQFQMSEYSIYGDYDYVPIQEDRRAQMEGALKEIHDICKPTISKLRNQDVIAEIQDSLFRKFSKYEGQLNSCIMLAKNVRDSNACADVFISQLKGEGRKFTLDILKNY